MIPFFEFINSMINNQSKDNNNNILTKYIIPLVTLLIFFMAIYYISNFFNISFAKVQPYILWSFGLLLFTYILPETKITIFEDSLSKS